MLPALLSFGSLLPTQFPPGESRSLNSVRCESLACLSCCGASDVLTNPVLASTALCEWSKPETNVWDSKEINVTKLLQPLAFEGYERKRREEELWR